MNPNAEAVLPLDHKRIAPLRSCESCSVRMARHRLEMPGNAGVTMELCPDCAEALRL